ncbi:MarR family winged helix-turn-helix transcriptional regulator, partial [Nocardiopsis protaetiae]
MDPNDGGTDSRVFWQLRRAFYAVDAEKERRLRGTGVSGPHYAVLMHVHLNAGISSAELARRLQVSPQNIAGLVSRLEDMGWLERRTHPRHRHVRELYLTEAGERAR